VIGFFAPIVWAVAATRSASARRSAAVAGRFWACAYASRNQAWPLPQTRGGRSTATRARPLKSRESDAKSSAVSPRPCSAMISGSSVPAVAPPVRISTYGSGSAWRAQAAVGTSNSATKMNATTPRGMQRGYAGRRADARTPISVRDTLVVLGDRRRDDRAPRARDRIRLLVPRRRRADRRPAAGADAAGRRVAGVR